MFDWGKADIWPKHVIWSFVPSVFLFKNMSNSTFHLSRHCISQLTLSYEELERTGIFHLFSSYLFSTLFFSFLSFSFLHQINLLIPLPCYLILNFSLWRRLADQQDLFYLFSMTMGSLLAAMFLCANLQPGWINKLHKETTISYSMFCNLSSTFST